MRARVLRWHHLSGMPNDDVDNCGLCRADHLHFLNCPFRYCSLSLFSPFFFCFVSTLTSAQVCAAVYNGQNKVGAVFDGRRSERKREKENVGLAEAETVTLLTSADSLYRFITVSISYFFEDRVKCKTARKRGRTRREVP